MKIRASWVLLHRYTGLAITLFLVIVGLTGSLLAFLPELEGAINSQFRVPIQTDSILNPLNVMESAERLDTAIKADSVWLSDTAATVGP